MCDGYKKVKPRSSAKEGGKGTFYGIGIGPGDAELLTLKAINILKKVDTVFAPKPNIESVSIAGDIIENYIWKKDKVKEIVFPMTKDKKILGRFWKESALRVYEELSWGKDVAFVTIGDPFIYSTYIYLLRHIRKLDRDLKVITIPGISAINAASSLLEVPLAEADERFAVMPLPEDLKELKDVLSEFDTVVLVKIGKDLGKLINFLKKEGFKNCSFFVRRIGYSDQYIAKDLSSLSEKTPGYLSTVIIRPQRRRK
jgi:precorrin-2/cobalt-factor-2 C20-methyltransferase